MRRLYRDHGRGWLERARPLPGRAFFDEEARLATRGFRVRLLERERYLGGKVGAEARHAKRAQLGVVVAPEHAHAVAARQQLLDHVAPQEAISALIVTHALQGKKVIRLKGGDVSFFSNVLDELQALRQHGIPFEIIPGVTAASGVSAYAGFPLTARGYAQGVQFIAFNPKNTLTEAQWKAIGETADTLVFYMATKNMALLAEALLRYGKKPDTALGLIEQATTRFQKVHLSSLQECKQDFENRSFSSPALVIVGDVVRLHREFSWYTGNEEGSVFEELPSR